jgi:hypothetical protein
LQTAGRIYNLKRSVTCPDRYLRGIGRPRKLRNPALRVDLSDFDEWRNGHDGQDSVIIQESEGPAVACHSCNGEGARNLATTACGSLDGVYL